MNVLIANESFYAYMDELNPTNKIRDEKFHIIGLTLDVYSGILTKLGKNDEQISRFIWQLRYKTADLRHTEEYMNLLMKLDKGKVSFFKEFWDSDYSSMPSGTDELNYNPIMVNLDGENVIFKNKSIYTEGSFLKYVIVYYVPVDPSPEPLILMSESDKTSDPKDTATTETRGGNINNFYAPVGSVTQATGGNSSAQSINSDANLNINTGSYQLVGDSSTLVINTTPLDSAPEGSAEAKLRDNTLEFQSKLNEISKDQPDVAMPIKNNIETIIKEIAKDNPDKETLKISYGGLLQAAENIKELMPIIRDIAFIMMGLG